MILGISSRKQMATLQNLNFVPTSISSCLLWLDAADNSTITITTGSVTQWNDKSGLGNNTTISGTPTISTAAFSSRQSILLNGTSYFNGNISITGATLTAFAVFQFTTTPSIINDNMRVISLAATGQNDYDSPSRIVVMNNELSAYPNQLVCYRSPSFLAYSSVLTSNTPYFASTQVTGTQGAIYLNGSAQTTINTTSGNFTISRYGVGSQAKGNDSNMRGYIAEVLIYSSSLTNSERQQIEGYLAWKWGLQGSLPSNHPFKLIAPNSAGLTFPSALTVAAPTQTIAVNPAPFVFNFSPTSVSGCQLWLDAYDRNAVVLGAGSNITRVIDKSPQNLTLTNAVSFTYDATNRAFVGPGGGGPVLGTATFSLATPACMFIVGVINTTGYFFDGLTATRRMGSLWNVASQYIGTTIDTTFVYPTTASNPYSTRSVFETVFNGASSLLYRNGTVVQTPSLGSPTITGLVIGSRYTLTEEALQGSINELIVYNSELGTTQRQLVEGYLAWKWGLQTSLPSNHPYRNAVPGQSITVPIPLITFQPGAFRPTQISGLNLWLDANDSSTITSSSGTVSQWRDKSANGLLANSNSIYVGTSLPTYNTSGTSYVQFAPNQALVMSSFPYTTAWSCFVCMNTVSLGTGRWLISPYGDLNLVFMGMNQGASKIFNSLLPSAPADATGNHIENTMAANTNGTGAYFWYRDGTLQTTSSSANTVAAGTVRLGVGANATISNAMDGTYQIYEILIYNSVLTTAQRQNIEGYLAWKWGLQANLPATHPFKRFPPPPVS